MWRKIGRITAILLLATVVLAGEVAINASVDKKNVPINDSLQLTIAVDGSTDLPGISLPVLNDFDVVGQSSATQIQIINGQQSNSRSYIFTLRPKKQGPAQIPALSFAYKDKTYKTNPLEVTVTAFATPNAQAKTNNNSFFDDDIFQSGFFGRQPSNVAEQQVFAELLPGKKQLYLGEKTLLNIKLYFERGFYQGPAIGMPKFSGLVVHDLGESQKQEEYNGKKLNCYSIHKEISPLQTGNLKIDPIQFQYISSPFGGVRTLSTKQVELTVRKLPSPQPENFSGAIGKFSIAGDFQPTGKLKTGTAIPLTITIAGSGNLDMVNELDFALSAGLTVYLDGLDTRATKGLQAKRVFKYFITAQEPGKYQLSPVQFCFFDPNKAQYQTIKFSLADLEVNGGSFSAKLAGEANNSLNIERGEINIKLDKDFAGNLLKLLKIILIVSFVLILLGLGGSFLYKNLFSPLNLLRKKFDRLKDYPDGKHFLEQTHQLFFKLVKLKDKIKLAGLPINEIENRLGSKERAEIITLLARKFEELKYTNNQQLSAEERKSIIENIYKLF